MKIYVASTKVVLPLVSSMILSIFPSGESKSLTF